MAALTVALVQMRCEKGAIDANLAGAEEYLRTAEAHRVGIVCFPEASITGYVDPRRYPEAVLRLEGQEVARFVALTRGRPFTALAGIIEVNPAGKPYITQVVARGGELLGWYRKRTIPDDERDCYAPAAETRIFTLADVPFGAAICADIDNPAVFADQARQGARVIFEAAAPGLYGEQATRDWRAGFDWWRGECRTKLGAYAREHRIHICVATQAGRTRDEDFPGGGYLFGPDGSCLYETPDWSEGTLYATIAVP